MSIRLSLVQRAFPARLKLWMLDQLAQVTADGFVAPAPDWPGRAFDERLAAYAAFTVRESEALLAGGDAAVVAAARDRLWRGASELGAGVRRRLGLRRPEEALAAWKLLYRQIGIEVEGDVRGEIRVTRCFFADHYTEGVCGLIAALDEGWASGLFGGATLEFSERLTGGRPCCRAILRLEGGRG